jgi:hypothetical protein
MPGLTQSHGNTADHFRAFLVEHATTEGRSKAHSGDLSEGYGHVIAHRDGDFFQVVQGLDESQPADDIIDAVDFHRACTDIDI